jgi:peptidoglycan/xylan/chitin deacetylase (PgdA/CDA1 family)
MPAASARRNPLPPALTRSSLTGSIKETLLAGGWYRRRLERDRFPGVAVLCYHAVRTDDEPGGQLPFEKLHVRAAELEAHCRLIRDTCNPLSLDDWRAVHAGKRVLPDRPVLLTFDDGYSSVFSRARPILERNRVPAVVFVCSAPIATRSAFWYDAMAQSEGESAVEAVKRASPDRWRAAIAQYSRPTPRPASPMRTTATTIDLSTLTPMTPDELGLLAGHELFEIGSHTANHPILASLPRNQQREEIVTSRAAIAEWTGRPVRAFAYPNGQPGIDYNSETVSILTEVGFDFGFTTRYRFAHSSEAPLERSRFLMLSGVSAAELAHRLRYSWRT